LNCSDHAAGSYWSLRRKALLKIKNSGEKHGKKMKNNLPGFFFYEYGFFGVQSGFI